MAFPSEYIEEPDLVFGKMKEEKDPRIGLKYHGPYFYSDEPGPSPTQVKIGVVSDAETSTLTKRLIDSFRDPIVSESTNKWLYPDFPGINLNTPIKCQFLMSDNWNVRLREAEIKRVIDIGDVNQRIAAGVNLSDKDLDFHNALKGKVMPFSIPIQLILSSTIRGFLEMHGKREIQEPATVAWNFATAAYYKANGKPWRLAKLRQDTCYVGISFFHNLLNPNKEIQTSMAQVFTHNGEGIVLRGTDVVEDKITRETHLSQKQAYELMADALKKYEKRAHRDPARVVIHKTTLFSEGTTLQSADDATTDFLERGNIRPLEER